jgi:hypothetical protein
MHAKSEVVKDNLPPSHDANLPQIE